MAWHAAFCECMSVGVCVLLLYLFCVGACGWVCTGVCLFVCVCVYIQVQVLLLNVNTPVTRVCAHLCIIHIDVLICAATSDRNYNVRASVIKVLISSFVVLQV